MTDEEKAEEWIKDHSGLIGSYKFVKYDYDSLKQAFLAGLKAGRPQWHKVADGDLPKYGYQVLSGKGVPVIYNRDTHSWFEYSPNADNIKLEKWEEPIAWCEKPKYKEE